MKNIQYELIINEALRSALEYDIPDEQINEFIEFFGKHIGSDRIYIFEDNVKKKVTNNTYEWCNEGILPQKDMLQNVDFDIIGWWYESFEKGESVVIPSVKVLKDTYPSTYDILNVQNVESLVVIPLRYRDEIRGFVGVDNPPIGNMKSISGFLDMIATLLISLLKLRNSFRKSNEAAKLSSYAALAEIYMTMHIINVKTGVFRVIKSVPEIDACMQTKDADNFSKQIAHVVESICSDKYKESVLAFTDLSTLEERMAGINTLAHEFVCSIFGWCRERFIKADTDKDGKLLRVMYCMEVIDEEKRRENRLLYLSETDSMTGLYNRGSGEQRVTAFLQKKTEGLFCLIDCDKFKSINDTYGHIVGDEVIVAVAETLQKTCRKDDIVMRLGGDEFALYIPDMKKEQAPFFIERLFGEFAKIIIPEMKGRKIYISLGAAFSHEDEQISFDQIYRDADGAMYESKKTEGYCYHIFRE